MRNFLRVAINTKVSILVGLMMLLAACGFEQAPLGKMPPTLELGKFAPEFSFEHLLDIKLQAGGLEQYRGKVVYIDFWASWCVPCRTSMPLLSLVRDELKQKGFEVIAVNLDDDLDKAKEFLLKRPVSYPVVYVPDGTISALYQVQGLPTSYLIDRQGVLRFVHQGFREGDLPIIRQEIESLLE